MTEFGDVLVQGMAGGAVASGELNQVAVLSGHKDRVWNLAWRPQGDILASCGGDKTIILWGETNDEWIPVQTLQNDHDRTVRRVAFSPDGNFLACASFDSTCSIYELRDGKYKFLQHLEGHDNEVKGIDWDCTGKLIATCSRDKSIGVYMLEGNVATCIGMGQSHLKDVKSVFWHPKEEILVSTGYDDMIKIWKNVYDDWVCVETLTGHKGTVWEGCFEPNDGEYFATVSDDCSIILWKFSNSKFYELDQNFFQVAKFENAHDRTIYSVSFWRQEPLIATCSGDDSIKIFSLKGFKSDDSPPNIQLEYSKQNAHRSDVNCVRWHPEKPLIASCGDDALVKIWSYN